MCFGTLMRSVWHDRLYQVDCSQIACMACERSNAFDCPLPLRCSLCLSLRLYLGQPIDANCRLQYSMGAVLMSACCKYRLVDGLRKSKVSVLTDFLVPRNSRGGAAVFGTLMFSDSPMLQ